ncbi:MAG: FG-GAP repeat domain-containing protein, partial [Candidatus Kapaibacteriota bacterium]
NEGSNNVSVLLNNGSGSYTAAVGSPFAVGTQPSSVAFGDVDGDGDLDVATANGGSNNVSVLLNASPMSVLGNVPPFTPRPTTNPLMNTMNYGTPSGSPVKVPMNTVPTGISVTFSQNATTATFNDVGASPNARDVMKVHGTTSRGYRSGQGFSGAGATMNFTTTAGLTTNFNVGEQVWVTVTHAHSTAGARTRPFVMGFRTKAGSGPGTFFPATNSPYASGSQTWFTALGDVDGDGDLDMASSFSGGTGGFYVRLNNGSGDFTTQAVGSPFTIASAQGLSFGDVDNDGDLDLAIVAAGSVHVRLNNGSGGFATVAPGSPIAVGTGARNVVFGDVNGDGVLDVAVPCQTAGQVYILWGAGTGAFGGGALYAHANAICAALGDIDNDGDLDLVSGDIGFYNVNVRLNTGGGLFSAVTSYAMGNSVSGVALADVNGDGYLDLGATCQFPTPQLVVRINDGGGGFATSAPGSPYSATGSLYSMNFADVDGDNDLDAVMANYVGGSDVAVRLNNSFGDFSATAAGSPFSAGLPGIGAARFATVGDVDGDGDLDVVTANDAGNSVSVLANTLAMNVLNHVAPFGMPYPPTSPAMNAMSAGTPGGSPMKVPLNIDIPFSQNLASWVFSNGTTSPTARDAMKVHGTTSRGYRSGTGFTGSMGLLTFTTTASFNVGEQVWVTVTNAQAAAGATTRPFVYGFRTSAGTGPGSFYPATTLPKIDNNGFTSCEVGDLDGDGDLDIVSTNAAGLAVHLQTGVNTGVFSLSTAFGWGAGSGAQARNIKLADVNNDGNLDAVAVNAVAPCALVVWVGNGAGGFGAAASYTFAGGSNTGSLSLADVDADGDLDAISGDFAANSLHVMLNNGSGAFTTAPGSPFAAGATLMTNTAVGDVDNDGDIDVCMVSATRLFVMLNNGVGRFASATGSPFAIGASNSMIALGDINGDGFLDAVFGDGATVHARLNNGSGTAWTASTGSPYAVGINARSLLADVDGNGRLDIVALGQAGSTPTHVLLNGGGLSPNFTPVVGSPFAREAGNIAAAAVPCTVGDMDGDGDLDIIYVTDTPANVTILKNGTQPLVSSVAPFRNGNTTMNNPNIAGVGAPVTVNFSTNITTNTYSVPPAQQLFQVHGGFTGSRTRASGFAPNGAYTGGAATMTFTPSANFRPGELVSVSVTNASSSVAAPNNSVGIRTRPFVFNYRVAAGVGPGNFSAPAAGSPFGAGAAARSAAFGDVDGDGDLDIATANQTGTNVTVLERNGSGLYVPIAGSPFAVGGALRSLVFGDV